MWTARMRLHSAHVSARLLSWLRLGPRLRLPWRLRLTARQSTLVTTQKSPFRASFLFACAHNRVGEYDSRRISSTANASAIANDRVVCPCPLWFAMNGQRLRQGCAV